MSFAVTDPTPTAPVRTDAAWLDAHWMPYTGNRQFKANPRMIVEGSGAYYTDSEGRKIFDGLSGLWCAGLGHGRREIAEAIGKQAMKLDYAPAFQFGHPLSFEPPTPQSLAGFIGARYAITVLQGLDAAPTRQNVLAACQRRNPLDLGGFQVRFDGNKRSGHYVTQSMLSPDGRVVG